MLKFLKSIVSPFTKKIRSLFSKEIDDSSFEHLEQIFYEADLGAETAQDLVEKVRQLYKKKRDLSSEEVLQLVKEELLLHLLPLKETDAHPLVIFIVGVNGSGKTTTLAKLSHYYTQKKKKVLVAAADTFRAAAIQQLEMWTQKMGVDLVKAKPQSDPSGVVFDALSAALARGSDVVLVDTAGRLQTKTELMHELAKMRRVCQKQLPEAPHETLLVVDATIGQNALDQAQTFHQFTPLSGIVLTKLDGSAKGGIAFAIQKQLKIPIQWVGLGEGIDDLERFDPKTYVEALFS